MVFIKNLKKGQCLVVIALMLFMASALFFTPRIDAAVSQTPPMGWNSYDCFNFSVTEAEVKANADYMTTNLLPYGWQYICVDWCWSFPGMGSQSTPNQDASYNPRLNMDSNGRLMPDTTRHPSSAGGQGFKPLADYVHGKGLKFGIHIMRGVPRQAVADNTPILGTSYHAADIADTVNTCTWLNHMYGLNMSHPGAQAYLNSLFQMYASWGVDYVKVDDLINPYGSPAYRTSEIEGYRNAITNCGREMVFSTSPGATPIGNASHISQWANQWRMANDLWDNWTSLNAMFDLAAQWYSYAGPGHWPDADMIPIGKVSKRGPNGSERYSSLTADEKYAMMSLWCICRSPLIWGGNLVENTSAELALMTNANVIAVNQNSTGNLPVTTGNTPVWKADVPGTNDRYLAMFNRTSTNPTNVSVTLSSIGITGTCQIKDLWTGANLGQFTTTFTAAVNSHGGRLFRVYANGTPAPTSTPTPTPTATPTPVPGAVKLSGTKFGTSPAYSAGCEYDKAFDGSTSTYFDYAYANGGYTGIDLGSAKRVSHIRYYPRASWAGRMVSGKFQGSNTSSSSGYVDLYTVPATPPYAWTQVNISDTNTYRYLRYLGPDGSYGNVAEVEFYGISTGPTTTPTPTPTAGPTTTPSVVWYKFDESSGTTGVDSSGNGKNGTLVNGPTWVGGKSGNAVNLDGSNDYVSMPSGIISSLNDFTIAAWVKQDALKTWSRIFDIGTGTTVNMFLTPSAGSAIRFAITTGGGSAEQRINGTATLATGTWKHVAVTLAGSTGILYVDGVEVGRNSSMTLKPSSLGSTTQNWIGRSMYSADPYLDGQVDAFRIYNRALSAAEVNGLFTAGN